jgi:hypothetical protein
MNNKRKMKKKKEKKYFKGLLYGHKCMGPLGRHQSRHEVFVFNGGSVCVKAVCTEDWSCDSCS